MLTAEFPPTSGDATLAGFSVRTEPEKIRRRIGYCPQFDAHFANMTGREHVELYASIKGVPRELIKMAAAAKLREVGLSEKDCDRLSSRYSGGMKRRLSLAIASIGHPQILFLDECSTGVDPVARREIWSTCSFQRARLRRALVMHLNTHSTNLSRFSLLVFPNRTHLGYGCWRESPRRRKDQCHPNNAQYGRM